MKKNISRNPLWPDWYNGKKIDEVQFGRAFLEQWPLKCVNGTLYTLDGPVEDESEIKQRILENIEEYVTSGLSKKVTNILETIKLLAFSDPFPIEQDCIHFQNGVYHLPDGSFQESRLFCQNRLPVKYDPKAASPDRWLTFLHELLDDADIPTLQPQKTLPYIAHPPDRRLFRPRKIYRLFVFFSTGRADTGFHEIIHGIDGLIHILQKCKVCGKQFFNGGRPDVGQCS